MTYSCASSSLEIAGKQAQRHSDQAPGIDPTIIPSACEGLTYRAGSLRVACTPTADFGEVPHPESVRVGDDMRKRQPTITQRGRARASRLPVCFPDRASDS